MKEGDKEIKKKTEEDSKTCRNHRKERMIDRKRKRRKRMEESEQRSQSECERK